MDKPKLPLAYFDGTDIAEGRELISPHGMNLIKRAMTDHSRDYSSLFLKFMMENNKIQQVEKDMDIEYWISQFEKEVYGTMEHELNQP